MNTLLMNFREDGDLNKIYADLKKLYPNVDIIKNPCKAELEKIRRNEEYLDMLDKAERELAEGKGIVITKEQLERWANG